VDTRNDRNILMPSGTRAPTLRFASRYKRRSKEFPQRLVIALVRYEIHFSSKVLGI